MRSTHLLLAAVVACSALPAAAQVLSPAERAFDDGVAAYRSGRYERALDAFQAAQRRGLRDPNLGLNLGLTLYRLGRYEEARDYFLRARRDLRYTAIADYHLGLIDARLGDRDAAVSRFAAVEAMATLPAIGASAGAALRELDSASLSAPELAPVTAPVAKDYVRLATGYDSNPELIGDSIDRPAANTGAAYAEVLGAMEHPLVTSGLGTTRFSLEAGFRQHADSEGFDRESGDLALAQDATVGDWLVAGGMDVGTAWLAWETYQNTWGVAFDGRRTVGDANLLLTAGTQKIDGQREFTYLDGWQHRATAELSRLFGTLRGQLGLELERNDRRDLAAGDEFASYSPLRYGVAGALGGLPLGRFGLEWRARYRHSRYGDPDRFLVNGVPVEQRRADTLAATGLRARYRGGERWSWILDYEYSRNASSLPEFSYARHEAALGIEWLR